MANDVNLIYINRAFVPETNSSFRSVQLPFDFTDGPSREKFHVVMSFSSVATLSSFIDEEVYTGGEGDRGGN